MPVLYEDVYPMPLSWNQDTQRPTVVQLPTASQHYSPQSHTRLGELQQPCPCQSQPARQGSPRHRLPLLVSFTSLSSLAHHFARPPGASPGTQLPFLHSHATTSHVYFAEITRSTNVATPLPLLHVRPDSLLLTGTIQRRCCPPKHF